MTLLTIVPRCSRLSAIALAMAMVLVAPVSAALAQTPTLGELAKKEQERRKALKQPPKVYSNKDLPKAVSPAPAPPSTPPATDAKAGEAPPPGDEKKPGDVKDEKDEAWWRTRITQARELLRRDEMFAEALQSRINGLSADVVNRDDPYQRAKLAEDRQKAIAELDRVKTEIEETKASIAGIEEEARKAGVPPGWLR